MEPTPIPFVEGWEFVQTLGEGAYGEVKLAVCQASQECVAVKIIHVADRAVEENVRKEVCVLKMLEHKNVIKYYGHRRAKDVMYLLLKYASGGELFDRIEPDVGIDLREALRYFHDLIEGVEYLHSRGVCHRDLKPENLLFDENDVLQITDFGMATIFRHQGQEREVNRMCGTKPYTAPEVLRGLPYRAEPADIWSCGIILVALLAGELPWDEPLPRNELYRNWKECRITTNPWNKIDTLALSLCRSVLCENPKRRYTIEQIKKHQFYNKSFPLNTDEENALSSPTSPPLAAMKRRRIAKQDDISMASSLSGNISCSQPERSANENSMSPLPDAAHPFSFSQPTHTEDLFLPSQMQCTPGTSQTPFQKLVKRMTRFFVINTKHETMQELTRILEEEGYRTKKNDLSVLTVAVLDRRKSKLIFKIGLIDMGGNLLVDFRLSKGDGIEFKRHFVRIKNKVKHIIRKNPPIFPAFTNINSSNPNALLCLSPVVPKKGCASSVASKKLTEAEDKASSSSKSETDRTGTGEKEAEKDSTCDRAVINAEVSDNNKNVDKVTKTVKHVDKEADKNSGKSLNPAEDPDEVVVRTGRMVARGIKRSTSV